MSELTSWLNSLKTEDTEYVWFRPESGVSELLVYNTSRFNNMKSNYTVLPQETSKVKVYQLKDNTTARVGSHTFMFDKEMSQIETAQTISKVPIPQNKSCCPDPTPLETPDLLDLSKLMKSPSRPLSDSPQYG